VLFPQSVFGSRQGLIEKSCWLTKMVEYMENDKKIGILSPAWFGANLEYKDYLKQVDSYCEVHKSETEEGIQGCFFMLRVSMLEELRRIEISKNKEPHPGFFDEVNFKVANWEDVDFSRRVRNIGYKTVVTHSIALYHFGDKTVYSDYTKDFPNFSEENRIRFFKKWNIPLGTPWTVSNSRLIWNGKEIESSYKNV
jgi:GT2 family glycosyltransferase